MRDLKQRHPVSSKTDAHTDSASTIKAFWCVEKDGGFTSVGVVVALALTIALVFSSAQVYWNNSTAGDIQFAADSGALAAENVVAEYYVIARVADAVVLSLSLFGLVVYGVAIVVSCIPYMQSVGGELMHFGTKVFEARDKVAEQSKQMLVMLQKALPFLAAANAASVISSNSFSPTGDAHYQGVAILVPLIGDEVQYPDDDIAQGSGQELAEQNQNTSEATDAAAEAAQRMEQAKLEAYMADCGAAPSHCMYERAGSLAGLSGGQNPRFASVDLWQFSYALDRARAYYQRRLANEAPADSSLEELIRSAVRREFYSYAVGEMRGGYARVSSDGVLDAYFPLLARNAAEIRRTRLYTSRIFPIASDGVVHGAAACPEFSGAGAGNASMADIESGSWQSCSNCNLSIGTISRVAGATSSIATGFEYHYRIVADAANRYSVASREHSDMMGNARESADEAFDSFSEALESLKAPRFDPRPPGRNGCIVVAFDAASHDVPVAFSSNFVSSTASLSPRVAISAAALAKDQASEGNSVLASFLDRAQAQAGSGGVSSVLGVFDGILTVWGDALLVYSRGADSMAQGVGDFLRSIPLVGSTPLASWAQSAIQETIEAFGLQGVDLSSPKPVIVNSIHVINASDSQALAILGNAKQAYSSIPGSGSGSLSNAVVDGLLVEVRQQGSAMLESEITIYTISFGDFPGAPSIPIRVKLPPAAVERGESLLDAGLEQLRSLFGGGGGNGAFWE
jgi:hypothetical protein